MQKYYVVEKDVVIVRGESEYFTTIGDLVPNGYKFRWAFRTPGGTFINVEKIN